LARVGLAEVTQRIADAARRAGRPLDSITLVAIGKGRPIAELRELYDAGHRHFGENRAQELAGKVGALPADVVWHFVGPLQTNKVRIVRPAVELLHSMDRVELGAAWVKGPGLPPPVLMQVNVGGEPQKHGVDPADAASTCRELLGLGLTVRGLMTLPPVAEEPEQSRRYFVELADLRRRLAEDFPTVLDLSMGMSDDFEVAVEEGATLIRVGRAIFGPVPAIGVS
jgi:pyridoxal phosphate enzyme (YggS family)